jgi:hypothetical protein
MTDGPYLNDPGYEVPDNKILVVPSSLNNDGWYEEIIRPLKGDVHREWFNSHFYYCLPINIGSQHGFVINSVRDFEVTWDGSFDNPNDLQINFLNEDNSQKQFIKGGFSNGVLTIQNYFSLKTPPGVNLMTIQPPNMFLPGCVALTGVVEADQIRRDFTFNLKITIPNYKITVKKGDALGAFIPIPRYYVDKFEVDLVTNVFDKSFHEMEIKDTIEFGRQRNNEDKEKPHKSGRRYFNGIHAFGEPYQDHQKRLQ